MTLIADSAGVAALCERLRRADYVTVDTEFMRETTFWSKVCLIQVAGPEDAGAIDALADGIDLTPLFDLLADERVPKVMHSARQDIEIFFQMTGKVPRPLFDTQVAAMVCGFGDHVGYETLIRRLTGHSPDKSLRFTDWSARPLSERHIAYALSDVTHLREAYEKLKVRLEQSGHAHWLEEEVAILTDPATYRIDSAQAWRRLKPRSEDRRYLAILQAIAFWREEEAMRRDIPRGRILRDEGLSAIAAHPPADVPALARLRAVPKGIANGRMGAHLLDAVRRGEALPLDQAPQALYSAKGPRAGGAVVELLKVLLKDKCAEHHVAQRLVASSDDIDRLAADDEAEVPALKGWRREVFGEDALRLKRGQVALVASGQRVLLVPVDGAGRAAAPQPQAGSVRSGRRRRRRPRKAARADAAAPGAAADDA